MVNLMELELDNGNPTVKLRGFKKGFFVAAIMLWGCIYSLILELFFESFVSKEFITLAIFLPMQIIALSLIFFDYDSSKFGFLFIIVISFITILSAFGIWKGVDFWYQFDIPDSIGINKATLLVFSSVYLIIVLLNILQTCFNYVIVERNKITIVNGLFQKKKTIQTSNIIHNFDETDALICKMFICKRFYFIYSEAAVRKEVDFGYVFNYKKKTEKAVDYLLMRQKVEVDNVD